MTLHSKAMKPASDRHVLVVEDEPRMRELLQRVLTNWGFQVALARSAEEAMRVADQQEPQIALLDLNLPGEGGMEFLPRLRARFPRVQAIVLTGFASLESAREAIHLDVVEFLTKPCHLGDLEKALDRAIRRLGDPAKPALRAPLDTEPEEEEADAPALTPQTGDARTLEAVERDHIIAALQRHHGNRTAAAAELGISRRTLYYKLEGYQRQGLI